MCSPSASKLVIRPVRPLQPASGGRTVPFGKTTASGISRWSPDACAGVDRSLLLRFQVLASWLGWRLFCGMELLGRFCRSPGKRLAPGLSAGWQRQGLVRLGPIRLGCRPAKDLIEPRRRRECPVKPAVSPFGAEGQPLRASLCREG